MSVKKYRISNDLLMVVSDSNPDLVEHKVLSNLKQYVDRNNFNSSVLTYGNYEGFLNKVWSTIPIYPDLDELVTVTDKFATVEFKCRAGFNWNDVFGMLVIIYNPSTSSYVYSGIIKQGDFDLTTNLELFQNDYWNVSYTMETVRFDANHIVYAQPVKYEDITIDGKVLTYPTSYNLFTPIVSESVLPPEILTSININQNTNYLEIQPYTTITDKTLEKVLLDFFGFENKIVPVGIRHVIKYGVTDDYKQISVSNEIDIYGGISIGLDFSKWYGSSVDVFVSTIYTINGSLVVKREQRLVFDYNGILEPTIAKLVHPNDGELVILPVEVVEENIVNQQVINTPVERKVVAVYQTELSEIVSTEFKWDSKNIILKDIPYTTVSALLVYNSGNDEIISKRSVDGLLYFDLTQATPPKEITEFKVYDLNGGKLILNGIINI